MDFIMKEMRAILIVLDLCSLNKICQQMKHKRNILASLYLGLVWLECRQELQIIKAQCSLELPLLNRLKKQKSTSTQTIAVGFVKAGLRRDLNSI